MNSIYKAGALIIKDKKLLLVRERGEDFFINPGGRIEEDDETPEEALKRELKEEIGITPRKISFFDTIKLEKATFADASFKMETYFVETDGKIKPHSEIQELKWVDSSFRKEGIKLTEDLENQIIPRLVKRGLIR